MRNILIPTVKNTFLSFLIISCFTFSECRKEPPLPEFYIRCKIDGQNYLPNNCANCMRGQILRDTVFLMNANADLQSIGMGLFDGIGIRIKTYILNGTTSGSADYKNSTTSNDIYKTDLTRIGELKITALDKTNKIIAGTFYFEAYNPVQNKSVNISNGQFRLRYTDY